MKQRGTFENVAKFKENRWAPPRLQELPPRSPLSQTTVSLVGPTEQKNKKNLGSPYVERVRDDPTVVMIRHPLSPHSSRDAKWVFARGNATGNEQETGSVVFSPLSLSLSLNLTWRHLIGSPSLFFFEFSHAWIHEYASTLSYRENVVLIRYY